LNFDAAEGDVEMNRSMSARSRLACACLVVAFASGCAMLRDPIEPPKPAGSAPADTGSGILEAISLAAQLAASGQQRQSPLALLAAAELLTHVQPRPLGDAAQMAGADATEPTKASSPPALEALALVAAAEAMGRGDPRVAEMATRIRQLASERPRGSTSGARGPLVHSVPRASRHTWRITFNAQQSAMVRVRGDGDTDLDCYVYSSSGRLVALDDDYTDYCALNWVPRQQEQFRIVIINRGNVYNRYAFWTN
jgi:hypothetical protein